MKQKKQIECVSRSEKIVTAKNGRLMMKCKCVERGRTKTKFIKGQAGGGELAGEALGFFKIRKGLPYMAKKSVEIGRFYGSEALKNKNLKKKAINYGLKKLTPVAQEVWSEALSQLSTKIRPKKA